MAWDWTSALRAARLHRGLTQAELARECGVAQGQVSLWENGSRKPNRVSWKRLEKALDIPSHWLASGLTSAPTITVNHYLLPAEAVREATEAEIAAYNARKRRK